MLEEEQQEELTNGIDHSDLEETYRSATVTVNMQVADVLGRPLANEEERKMFLALASSFFGSDIVYQQLQYFVQMNMNPQNFKQPDIIVPDKKLIVP
jgi:hypothetical protein